MRPRLADVAGEVEADPGAVFDAHGAESVDELVAGGNAPDRDAASDRVVRRLFEGDLDRPERRSGVGNAQSATTSAGESTTVPAVLADLERAIDASEREGPADLDPATLAEFDDAEVADAFAAAEALEDGDLPESVPEEWR